MSGCLCTLSFSLILFPSFLFGFDPTFETTPIIDSIPAPTVVVTADFDADGDYDLAISSSYDTTITILKNNGDGTFAPKTGYAISGPSESIAAVDLDGCTAPPNFGQALS